MGAIQSLRRMGNLLSSMEFLRSFVKNDLEDVILCSSYVGLAPIAYAIPELSLSRSALSRSKPDPLD